MFSCGQSSLTEGTVDANTFERMMNDSTGAIVLDVRTSKEFANGHIPGAVLIDVNDEEFESKINELDKSKPILVYCAAGIRSEKASEALRESGFPRVYHLQDGLKSWVAAQKKLSKQ